MKFYITTAIDYVNSLPHLGTAYEKVAADAIARFKRLDGYDVRFQMGNDEHSANVKKEADKLGLPPKKYCDDMRVKFEDIWKSLDISYDDFIQTSEPRHHAGVKAFIDLVRKNNPDDIFEKEYEGWYCESCEAFQTEKDLVDGLCPNHKTKPKWLQEKNFFFRLSAYRERLLKYYEEHPDFILPKIRRNEVLRFVETELQDISVSRANLPWGIPFPDKPSDAVYVWFDALVNYLSALGFGASDQNYKKFWPADLHVVGKDITRFHCVIWPAMLMSAGLPLPKTVFGHGFVYLKGEKMSKSLGNVVTPLDVVPKYGADALRYYLLRESSFGSDGDFTWDNFIKRFNSDLANDLGNLLNRTLGMATKYLGGNVAKPAATVANAEDEKLKSVSEGVLEKIRVDMDYAKSGDVNFHKALAAIWEAIAAADKYIDTCAPWKLEKENKKSDIQRVLYNVLDTVRNVAILVSPFIPGSAGKIWDQLGLKDFQKQNFKNIAWSATPDLKVGAGQPIFPRIELESKIEKKEEKKMENKNQPQRGVEGEAPTARPTEGATQAPLIDIADFAKIDLRIAEIKQAEKVEGADRLLKLQLDLGGEARQIVSGIAQNYTCEELVGKKIVLIANLKPAKIRGVESHGMLLAASDSSGLSVLTLDRPGIASGSKAK